MENANAKYLLSAQSGDCIVYAAQRKTFGAASTTDHKAEAIEFDERDASRFPTLVKFWSAVTGLQFSVVTA